MKEYSFSSSNEEHDSVSLNRRRIIFPLKSNIFETSNTDPIQIIWEPIRDMVEQIEKYQQAIIADQNTSKKLRVLNTTHHIGVTQQLDIEKSIEMGDALRLVELKALEDAVQILLEGLNSVDKGIRPSKDFFLSLDDIIEGVSQEMQRIIKIDMISQSVDSKTAVEVSRHRLKVIQDFKATCLSLEEKS